MAKMKKIEALCLQELSLKQLKMWLEEDQDAILNKVIHINWLSLYFFPIWLGLWTLVVLLFLLTVNQLVCFYCVLGPFLGQRECHGENQAGQKQSRTVCEEERRVSESGSPAHGNILVFCTSVYIFDITCSIC